MVKVNTILRNVIQNIQERDELYQQVLPEVNEIIDMKKIKGHKKLTEYSTLVSLNYGKIKQLKTLEDKIVKTYKRTLGTQEIQKRPKQNKQQLKNNIMKLMTI